MSTPKKQAKKAVKKTAKKAAKKKGAKKLSATEKLLSKHAKVLLKAAGKATPAGKPMMISLKPTKQKAHVLAFNHALQSIAKTKGMELDETSSVCDGDPEQTVLCAVNGDHILMKRRECCALIGG
ncbi:MAG TPA: hypothetical protein VHE34_25760 [Puia sp.]|uniref:hypothetical protein n=1 Tax=Puia sp. TaxID=2045100 RepID=UPI002CB094D6|nr:hypothetical protein [Puia sp.]HVU98665.1 hypothetical protein [Puia sp.]